MLTYNSWKAMIRRCYRKTNSNFKHYGARGIKVCPSWKNSFEAFIGDMGLRPSKNHTLDRIKPNKDYCKNNCRWASKVVQNRNKRNSFFLTFNNKTQHAIDWANELQIPYHRIHRRIRNGWTVEEALSVDSIKGRTDTPRGKRQNNRLLTFKGKTQSVTCWAKELDIEMRTLHNRLKLGWSIEDTLSKPLRQGIRNIVKANHSRTSTDLGSSQLDDQSSLSVQ